MKKLDILLGVSVAFVFISVGGVLFLPSGLAWLKKVITLLSFFVVLYTVIVHQRDVVRRFRERFSGHTSDKRGDGTDNFN